MEDMSLRESMLEAMGRIVNELARYRRMVQLEPDMHEMTVEGFDARLNEMCDEAYRKYEGMSMAEVVIDALMTKAELEKAYKEKRNL